MAPLLIRDNEHLRQAVEKYFSDKTFKEHYPITDWITTRVTDMSNLFLDRDTFNEDISKWDTSNVTTMESMFSEASSFDKPINTSPDGQCWNVSNVTDMSYMFHHASNFNQNISNWNVSNVTTMENMFEYATAFNQPINTSPDGQYWNVSNVTDMGYMFHGAHSFNKDISKWNTSKVVNMAAMFSNATSFNKPINTSPDGQCWNVSNVGSMRAMFLFATSFNQPINSWVFNSNVDVSYMFKNMFQNNNLFLSNPENYIYNMSEKIDSIIPEDFKHLRETIIQSYVLKNALNRTNIGSPTDPITPSAIEVHNALNNFIERKNIGGRKKTRKYNRRRNFKTNRRK